MPRTRKRTTSRGSTPQSVMETAAHAVVQEGRSIRSVAQEYSICHVSLYRFCKKLRADNNVIPKLGYNPHTKVFTNEQESILTTYLKTCGDLYYGLSPKEIKQLAYHCAKKFNLRMPQRWSEMEMAGPDWFTSFMKRNPDISLRKPEATSLNRAMNFNKIKLTLFSINMQFYLKNTN